MASIKAHFTAMKPNNKGPTLSTDSTPQFPIKDLKKPPNHLKIRGFYLLFTAIFSCSSVSVPISFFLSPFAFSAGCVGALLGLMRGVDLYKGVVTNGSNACVAVDPVQISSICNLWPPLSARLGSDEASGEGTSLAYSSGWMNNVGLWLSCGFSLSFILRNP